MVDVVDIHNAGILIVDDLEANVRLVERILGSAGYTSVAFTMDPREVCELHRQNHYDLIILDLLMPDMDGFEVMEGLKALEMDSYLPVLVITAEPSHKLRALHAGAKDFISIPFDMAEVQARVYNMLEVRLLHMETKHYSKALEQYNHALQQEISNAQLATILAMSKLVEARDGDTGKHVERTSEFCRRLAQQLHTQPAYATLVDDKFVDNIYHASLLHDIGKVAIQDKILRKHGKLTPAEFTIIKTHTLLGAATLQSVHDRYPQNAFITLGIQIARAHHERWDGSGYPDGLMGEAIPLSAQIMALADTYDALRATRCYRTAFPHARSREIILAGRGQQFSPTIVDAFIVLEQEFESIHTAMLNE